MSHDKIAEPIAIDSNPDEDSSYLSGSESYSTSLSSSIYKYRYENGRRYHAYRDGNYVLPNDQQEQDRLDIMHHIYLLMLDNKLHLAPIGSHPQRILDVGTGTGIWAVDMAEIYPSAEIIGTDLSPIQPSWIPPNLNFLVDDAESAWSFCRNSFDYIHIRHLCGSIKDWPLLFSQAFECMKPGGWLEVAEYELNLGSDDGTYNDKTAIWRYYDLVNKAAAQNGRVFDMAPRLGPLIQEAGFQDTKHMLIPVPLGTWAKDAKKKEQGGFLLLTADTAFEAFGVALLTRVLKMDTEEVQTLIADSKKDAKSRKIHAYSRQHIYIAQKPVY